MPRYTIRLTLERDSKRDLTRFKEAYTRNVHRSDLVPKMGRAFYEGFIFLEGETSIEKLQKRIISEGIHTIMVLELKQTVQNNDEMNLEKPLVESLERRVA